MDSTDNSHKTCINSCPKDRKFVHNTTNLRSFGNENLDFVSEEAKKQYLMSGVKGLVDMIDFVFFNEDHPENHNVQLKSSKHKLVEVYKSPKWIVEPLSDTAYSMFDKVITAIQPLFECVPEQIKREIFNEKRTVSKTAVRLYARLVTRRDNQTLNGLHGLAA